MIIMTSNVVGSQAFYYCDAGFQLNGLAIRECTTSGEWSGAEPTCTRQQCEAFMPDRIFLREDAIFTAEIGPSANPRGYTGITGLQ